MSSITDKLEEKGIKIDSLNSIEKATYFNMLAVVKESQLTPEKLREYVVTMRESVERELVNEPTFIRIFIFKVENPKLLKLQARLQNYLLLESFLISPEKAEAQLEDMVNNLTK